MDSKGATTAQPQNDLVEIGLEIWQGQPSMMPFPHRHSEIELNFVEQGAITYIHRDSYVTINAGQLIAFWGAIPHQLVDVQTDSAFYYLTIPLELFLAWELPQEFMQVLLFGDLIADPETSDASYNSLLFRRWHADLNAQRSAIALMEIKTRLWRLALMMKPDGITAVKRHPVTEGNKAGQMAQFIITHYTETLSVCAIADAVDLHPNYAMQLFKKTFKMSLLDYVIQYRIAQAQRLLLTTDDNVLDIAMRTGFGSSSNFYVTFKKLCGQSPGAYRQVLRT